jgi:dihydrofolate synthase/folylpolyglutamate synthase
MIFAEAERYVLGLIDEKRSRGRLGLDRMRALLHELGDPQDAYSTVHVAGTSGKGSTATMIAAALSASGKRVGLHTKPHLHSMTERAAIDGMPIPPQRFADLLEEMVPAIERIGPIAGMPSYYETLLALTFLYFAKERVDIAAIEVGVGGRLDGTNVICPRVAVITSVDYDHTEILGETLEAIAAEKAGIAKPGVPLIVAAERPEALAIIERVAGAAGSPVILVDHASEIATQEGDERRFEVKTARGVYDIRLPVFGSFQRRNARTAILALEALPHDLAPSVEEIERGLGSVAIPGRMEVVGGNPTVVLDIAHNAEKAEHLADALRERWPERRMRALVAVGQGKDATAILDALAPLVDAFIFTSFSAAGRRAIAPQVLLDHASSLGVPGEIVENPSDALSRARERAVRDQILVITGSTFVVAELREEVLRRSLDPTLDDESKLGISRLTK